MQELIDIIERGFDSGGKTANDDEAKELRDAVGSAIEMLDAGKARVA